MAWTAPRTWVVGELVTAAIMNTYIRDNQTYLTTREITIPLTLWWDDSGGTSLPLSPIGAYPRAILDVDDYGLFIFDCPDTFVSIVEAKAVCIGIVTDAATDIDILADFASTGQAYNTHQTSDLATTYNVTTTQFFEIDLATILAAMVAGDHVGIKILNKDANDISLTSMFLRYLVGT